MRRVVLIPVVLFGFLVCAPDAFAQAQAAKPAPATAAAPAAPSAAVAKARMAVPVKGTAYIEVISQQAKQVGGEIVQTFKVKNVSNAPIAGLRIDQYWFSKAGQQVSGDTQRVRYPIAPGEVVDVALKSPAAPDVFNNRTTFVHANGKVDAKGVKSFTDATAAKNKK